jgi:adenosylmethionine-8-amino-7-oxononanoate aminotransferase
LLTYGGHAVACAAALANLDIIEGEGLVDNSAKMGTRLLKGLEQLRSHPTVGDVRGLGLIAGVEIVKDKGTKETFSESGEEIKTLSDGLLSRNLLTRAASVISLSPPLCITEDEVDRIVEIADGAITDMEKKFGYA